ncbi:MAG: glycogen/starch synthase [Chitinophagales bacterium]|nr:glycogen/starch synthase [Chitinophagales bacterium]MDW8393862.1 glycogen/starch synthase [Chitinophagales bacterium]
MPNVANSQKLRILIITQEMKPYLMHSEMARIAHQLPIHLLNAGNEIRVLMPRFGTINERRHRLHEVVRLSGMNIIIDDDDYPLIIKVASLPGARLQVYFLDNEEFFKRKFEFTDEKKKPFADNAERMIFFCKGALETVKKWGWPPDIIHCHGWMTSLIPMYLKTVYRREPVFQNAKVVYSVYNHGFEGTLSPSFQKKALIHNNISDQDFSHYRKADFSGLNKGAVSHADATIVADKELERSLKTFIKGAGKPVLEFVNGEEYLKVYHEFYRSLLKR